MRAQKYKTSDIKTIGNKKEVWDEKAIRTAGGLTKADLTLSKTGKVVSLKKQIAGKKLYYGTSTGTVLRAHQFRK